MKEPSQLTSVELQKLLDEELVIRLRDGCDDALAVLFDRYHRLVRAIAARIVRDDGEAEDVMQTVFLDIYRAKAQFDPCKGSVKVWLLQYAYHRSFNRRQQLSSRNFYNQTPIQEIREDDRALMTSGRGTLPSAESSVLLREALATLSRAERATLELAYFDGLTMQEIAAKTGETIANVRHHFYRGLDKLRSYLRIEPRRVRAQQGEVARVES